MQAFTIALWQQYLSFFAYIERALVDSMRFSMTNFDISIPMKSCYMLGKRRGAQPLLQRRAEVGV